MITAKDMQAVIERRNAANDAGDSEEFAKEQRRLVELVAQAKHEWWSERAAIREYDGGMPRADAEAAAWDDVGGKP